MDLNTVLSAVDSWPVEDRIRLMGELWDRLVDRGYEPSLTAEESAELDRRWEADEAAPDDVVAWEEVKADALARARR